MSANSKPKTLNNSQWLRDAADQLADASIPTAKLDAEIILAHTLRRSRTWLHAHDDETLTSRQLEIADARLDLRLSRVPVAYIVGHKEFYGRLFKVSPAVLIPRPESETAIELLKKLLPTSARTLLDVGTGSGCLGITAKLELPDLDVTLSDISSHALTIARENAANLHADVSLLHSDLLRGTPGIYDVIIANLPYVDESWQRSPETDHEPNLALFAKNHGMKLIEALIEQLPDHLAPGGLVLLEADPSQFESLQRFGEAHRLTHTLHEGYYLVFTYA